jgi:hypothetical protein
VSRHFASFITARLKLYFRGYSYQKHLLKLTEEILRQTPAILLRKEEKRLISMLRIPALGEGR